MTDSARAYAWRLCLCLCLSHQCESGLSVNRVYRHISQDSLERDKTKLLKITLIKLALLSIRFEKYNFWRLRHRSIASWGGKGGGGGEGRLLRQRITTTTNHNIFEAKVIQEILT